MPNTTGDYPMPYPNSSAVPDVPGDILALAQEVDDTLTAEFGALPNPSSVAVVPTSVAGTGVTVSATGLVTFASSTTVTIDGCFTSAFRNYRVVFDATGTAATIAMTLRVAGVDSVTNYDLTENLARNGAVSSSTALNAASWAISGAVGGNTVQAGTIEVFVPAVTRETRIVSQVGSHANPAVLSAANALKLGYGTHRPTTAYDGFKLVFSAAQSGTIRVEGIN